jgi:exodeoxyribonuclease-1
MSRLFFILVTMSQSFYWYDYETWGINPKTTRPSQFAGLRTDLDFNTIGDPLVLFSKPTDDFLPEPDAVMVTGVSPQKALEEGINEAEFAAAIHAELSKEGTISLGYNTIRFDEGFNRYLLWRNFYNPYDHSWKNNCSTWDIIDMVRLTRALRPEGIVWPEQDGKPTNRLEKLSVANGIEHEDAHDALADVYATIGLAKLIKTKQPKLFDYLLNNRDKKSAAKMLDVNSMTPVVHASDKFGSDCLSTALVVPVAELEDGRRILVFDLKTDPQQILDLTAEQIAENMFTPRKDSPEDTQRIGAKGIKLNASPVLAPESTLDDAAAERILLDRAKAKKHLAIIKKYKEEIAQKLIKAHDRDWSAGASFATGYSDAESKLYDGFTPSGDADKFDQVRATEFEVAFQDERLQDLLAHYKARNYPEQLTDEEKSAWEKYRSERLFKSKNNFETFGKRLAELAEAHKDNSQKLALLEDLQLYAESIYPINDD